MGRRAHVRLDDALAPPRARLRRAHRLFRSHDTRRSRKPLAQANSSRIGVFKRTLSRKGLDQPYRWAGPIRDAQPPYAATAASMRAIARSERLAAGHWRSRASRRSNSPPRAKLELNAASAATIVSPSGMRGRLAPQRRSAGASAAPIAIGHSPSHTVATLAVSRGFPTAG